MNEKILCNNFVEGMVRMKLHVYLYVEASLKKITTTNVAYVLLLTVHILVFLFLYCLPLVEGYMDDIDKSWGSGAVFGVRCFIRIPSLCHSLPVILREELFCHQLGTDGKLLPGMLAWTWKLASTTFVKDSTLYLL